jgi:hypothetical protein
MREQNNNRFAVSIGPEEHRRLKILAAELSQTMSDLINAQVNELWNKHKKGESNNGSKEK